MREITTEKDLIEALSSKGRFLEYCGDWVYRVKETQDGERSSFVCYVSEDVGDTWTDGRDYGAWCSTWHLPDFWPWPLKR